MSSDFRYQPFVAVCGNFGAPVIDGVLSSHEREINPTTSVDENCREFEFQLDWSSYVDLRQTKLALKVKFVKGRCYKTYESKETKKGEPEKAKADVEKKDKEQEVPSPLVAHVINILLSIVPYNEVFISNQQIKNSNGLHAHKSYLSNKFKLTIPE